MVKYSFYAGMLTYNSTISVNSLHKHCKDVLNTMGNGWRQSKDFFQINYKIEPINPLSKESIIPPTGRDNPCEKLLLASDEDDTFRFETDLIVSLPQIETDDNDDMLNIRLPFKRKQNFNFNSKASAFVLLKYYVTVSQCYEFRKLASARFDMRFSKLVKEKFLPFIQREQFYPGFGAILRISESLNHRAIVSRNIVDDPDDAFKQLKSNRTDNNSDDFVSDARTDNYKTRQNESTFFEQVIHFISSGADNANANESKKIEILFFILVATVLSLAFSILCCCIIIRSRQKTKKSPSQESHREEKKGCFASCFNRFKNNKKGVEKSTVSESNIGPRSSSILVGNDFDDTGIHRIKNDLRFEFENFYAL